MSLFLIAALPFIGALLPGLMIQAGRNTCSTWTGIISLSALIGLLVHAPAVLRGEVITASVEWMPALGLNASFYLDGLGLLFGTLILGIGCLIILYARFYLSTKDPMGNFYTYLLLFQGAMVGIVLSDNILMLLVFWELTSLSSFLLIGYWKHLPEGRQGARMALTVTGMGGLGLIGGMLLLGHIAGTYELTELLEKRDLIQADPLYVPALLLILLGAFTKSAQFPFHFWLPRAMAAPTPVSAYLHSATMVKAGLFLMARLYPVMSGTTEWFWIVTLAGLITMVLGALIGIFQNDLKGLLAYSTVSHLGLITMLLGFSTEAAAIGAVFHIINHASFKASLFMTAGIVDHEAHTRDITRLGGLRHLMPITFVITAVASLSMAGIPPFNGFLSKEMMLEAAAHAQLGENAWLIPALATLGALFSVAYSFRLLLHTWFGAERHDYPHHPHDPPFGMWLSPALLAVLVVLIGLFSQGLVGGIVQTTAASVLGNHAHPHVHLALWHGVTPALYMSGVAVLGGLVLLALYRPAHGLWHAVPRPDAKVIFDAIIDAATKLANWITDTLHDGKLTRYAAIFFLFTVLASWHAFSGGAGVTLPREPMQADIIPIIAWFALIAATGVTVYYHRHRLLALVVLGIIGVVVSLSFNYLSAPDLALTQLSVEVVTIVLLLLALNFLPEFTPKDSGNGRHVRDIAIAVFVGGAVAALSYVIMLTDFAMPSIAEYHLAQSHDLAGGNNVVNVILVDFRGFDTFGEITVLGIAALIIYGVTEGLLGSKVRQKLLERKPNHPIAGDEHPMMMVVATRLLLPIALMVGVYIYLRGHNDPGGGFVAGLIVAIALLMQYMASGYDWADKRQRFPYHASIACGVMAAGITGIGAFFNNMPFLTSDFGYFQFPPLQKFELATAMGFDLGVFLAVVGAVMLTLESLSRLAYRRGDVPDEYPMDINPSRQPKNEDH
ncbi:monovalent cation/H+ antiporter subunit A [Donghicola sp. C2-DW-16]|uniref:Monovalent cation/H+ antiporter subunit A n=1 Tax=Donghicola mangrovi TaxID=2729614 RepID=A0ABX2PAM5_9RHOB|nr:monovalent cation/H+ antiporter subunit A [Donghicola mangrovi]